jgi:hypothetical protein
VGLTQSAIKPPVGEAPQRRLLQFNKDQEIGFTHYDLAAIRQASVAQNEKLAYYQIERNWTTRPFGR